ncbi:MAG: protocatechuate 3,4-dioxygenase [Planctomycetota bacterium]
MDSRILRPSRREFLTQFTAGAGALAFGSTFFTTPGLFAEELTRTARQVEGPFYPDKLPLDTDNDLLIINDKITPAVGKVTHLSGRVLDLKGKPLRNVVVEIWQCDSGGAYLHTKSANDNKRDKNFQGFGRFLTNAKGEYYFRTIRPVPYPGRTPHIHLIVKKADKRLLTSQLYVAGDPGNEKDVLYRRIKTKEAKATITIPFKPIKDSKIGELSANADIIVGLTPEDSEKRRR